MEIVVYEVVVIFKDNKLYVIEKVIFLNENFIVFFI